MKIKKKGNGFEVDFWTVVFIYFKINAFISPNLKKALWTDAPKVDWITKSPAPYGVSGF